MGFFPEAIERIHPAFAGFIDRSRKVRFLDKELRETLGRSPRPRQQVDLLAEVPVKDLDLDWVPTHVEVQRRKDRRFAERMLHYHSALIRRFGPSVMSLAILSDPNPKWRSSELTSGVVGLGNRFEVPICKLSDITDAELESDPNPVNLVILAERVARRHRKDPMALREGKVALFRRMAVLMKSKRYSDQQRQVLTRVLDWSISLPKADEPVFLEQLRQIQGDIPMTYLTTFERHARREGLEQGRQEGRLDGLRAGWVEAVKALATVRFPDWKPSWNRYLESLDDADVLQDWLRLATESSNGAAFLEAIGKRPE